MNKGHKLLVCVANLSAFNLEKGGGISKTGQVIWLVCTQRKRAVADMGPIRLFRPLGLGHLLPLTFPPLSKPGDPAVLGLALQVPPSQESPCGAP